MGFLSNESTPEDTRVALLDLNAAVDKIARLCRGRTPPDTPFFFLVGAGISVPMVKSAWGVQEELRLQALADDPTLAAPQSDPMATYAFWLENALPSRGLRRAYFERLIRDQRISSANYRLAMLLVDGRVANVVVTPNFDDFLSRALTLFGRQHIICDHPLVAERIDGSKREIQIVHVHGTYWFYTLANQPHEAREWEGDEDAALTTIPRRLGELLFKRSPLVIGYSGWERDVIMRQVLHRLGPSGRPNALEHPLFWFCYSEDDYHALHPIVAAHPDVNIVVSTALRDKLSGTSTLEAPPAPLIPPAVTGAAGSQGGGGTGLAGVSGISEAGAAATASSQALAADARRQMGSEAAAETLSADLVLRRLQQKIAPATPQLLSDPLHFFKDQLTKSFPPDAESDGSDVLRFAFTVRRVDRAMQSAEYQFEERLAPLVEAFRGARYDDVLQAAHDVRYEDVLEQQQLELADLAFDAARELDEDDERTRRGFELAERIYSQRADAGTLSEERSVRLCRSLFRISGIGHALHDATGAESAETRLLARFGEKSGEAYDHMLAVTMMVRAGAEQERGDFDRAVQLLQQLDGRYRDSASADVRFIAASGLALMGYAEMARGNLSASRNSFTALAEHFAPSDDARIRSLVASAMTGEATALMQEGWGKEALALYERVIVEFREATDDSTRAQVGLAYAGAVYLGATQGDGGTRAFVEEARQRFGRLDSPADYRMAANVLVNVALSLLRSNSFADARDVCEQVIAIPAGDVYVEYARANACLLHALCLIGLEDATAGERELRDIIEQHATSAATSWQLARGGAMRTLANLLASRGQTDDGTALLKQVGDDYREASMAQVRLLSAQARIEWALVRSRNEETRQEGVDELVAVANDPLLLDTELLRGLSSAAALNVGVIHIQNGGSAAATSAFEGVVRRFGELHDLTSRVNVANAEWNLGLMLQDAKPPDLEGARARFESMIDRVEGIPDALTEYRSILARIRLSFLLRSGGDAAGGYALFDATESRLSELPPDARRVLQAAVSMARAECLYFDDHDEEALTIFERALSDATLHPSPLLRNQLAFAFCIASSIHLVAKRPTDALRLADEGLAWADAHSGTEQWIGRLLLARGMSLDSLDQTEAAIAQMQETVDRFGRSSLPGADHQLDNAVVRLMDLYVGRDDAAQALAVGDVGAERFADAADGVRLQRLSYMLAVRVSALVDLGRHDEARLAWDAMAARLHATGDAEVERRLGEARRVIDGDAPEDVAQHGDTPPASPGEA